MLPQRISSIHSKVSQIHAQLRPMDNKNNNGNNSRSADAVENGGDAPRRWHQSLGRLSVKMFKAKGGGNCKKGDLLCSWLRKQLFCSQCLKLFSLFAVAITHLLFLHPFLELFSQLEEYAAHVNVAAMAANSQQGIGASTAVAQPTTSVASLLRLSVHEFAEYKKNIWMTVSVLCVALSTTSFFLFLLPSAATSPIRKRYVFLVSSATTMVGLVDTISFGCLPPLFSARASIVQLLHEHLGPALEQAHKIISGEKLMNEARCSIQPREKLPFCSELILRSMFPADLLKFLLVLCVLTLAYLLVAYVIYWCIKHWIPHGCCSSNAGGKFCHYCASHSRSSWNGSPAALPKGPFLGSSVSYVPLSQSEKPIFVGCLPPPLVVPNPLMTIPSPPSQCSPASLFYDEPIPTEPTPSDCSNEGETTKVMK